MGLINISEELLRTLQESTCFGLANDDSTPECQRCDVRAQCKAKMNGDNVPLPVKEKPKLQTVLKQVTSSKETKKKTENKVSKPTNPTKPKTPAKKTVVTKSSVGLPVFKDMTWEELSSLAKQRNVTSKDYGNPNINRMRLIMALKKSYK